MHPSVMKWVGQKVEEHNLAGKRVLDVGGYNVNGTCRTLFTGPYWAVDARLGPGVDEVMDANCMPYPDDLFEVVLSTEMLEHDPFPWLSVAEMARVLHPGGWLLLTCRGFDERGQAFPHDHPGDFWRPSIAAMEMLVRRCGLYVHDSQPDPTDPGGVFLSARKPYRRS